ncbi:MAG: saccharopine dehydrogenase family protein [Candidatus Nanopelagicales bacterium]
MADQRELDVVVYGASGFVGKLLADYLARHAPEGTRIGLAGRSQAKLAAVRDELPAAAHDWPLLIADADDHEALGRMASSTTAVATTVGPYAKYGMGVAAACAANGTHYADLTGEALFVRRCADEFDAEARRTGARIVNSCGFDSIPSDLGVYETYLTSQALGDGGLGQTRLIVTGMRGGFSGGTVDSLRNQMAEMERDPSLRRLAGDPYGLSPDRAADPTGEAAAADKDVFGVGRDPALGVWTGPFVMATYNTRIVRRSNALLDHAYGPDFHYQEFMGFGSSPLGPVMAAGMVAGLGGLVAGMRFGPTRSLLDRVLPAPGEGPGEEARRSGYFRMEIHAMTDSGQPLRTKVAAQGDPGYAATAVMLGQSVLCLALDGEVLPKRAGVLTPAVAMGRVLADRLRDADFTIETSIKR